MPSFYIPDYVDEVALADAYVFIPSEHKNYWTRVKMGRTAAKGRWIKDILVGKPRFAKLGLTGTPGGSAPIPVLTTTSNFKYWLFSAAPNSTLTYTPNSVGCDYIRVVYATLGANNGRTVSYRIDVDYLGNNTWTVEETVSATMTAPVDVYENLLDIALTGTLAASSKIRVIHTSPMDYGSCIHSIIPFKSSVKPAEETDQAILIQTDQISNGSFSAEMDLVSAGHKWGGYFNSNTDYTNYYLDADNVAEIRINDVPAAPATGYFNNLTEYLHEFTFIDGGIAGGSGTESWSFSGSSMTWGINLSLDSSKTFASSYLACLQYLTGDTNRTIILPNGTEKNISQTATGVIGTSTDRQAYIYRDNDIAINIEILQLLASGLSVSGWYSKKEANRQTKLAVASLSGDDIVLSWRMTFGMIRSDSPTVTVNVAGTTATAVFAPPASQNWAETITTPDTLGSAILNSSIHGATTCESSYSIGSGNLIVSLNIPETIDSDDVLTLNMSDLFYYNNAGYATPLVSNLSVVNNSSVLRAVVAGDVYPGMLPDINNDYSTVPLDQRVKFKGQDISIYFQDPGITHNSTSWRIWEATNASTVFNINTTANGLVGENIGNISYGSLTELRIALDRAKQYYVQIKINEWAWGTPVLIDMQPRSVALKHRTSAVVTDTTSGATVSQSSPRWTEQKTASGATIVNLTYSAEQTSGQPTETIINGRVVIDNS